MHFAPLLFIMENRLILSENRIARLIEMRSVGGFKYSQAIRFIVQYCSSFIISNKPQNEEWKISVPERLTKRIDIFSMLNLNITIVDITGKELPLEYESLGNLSLNNIAFVDSERQCFILPQTINITAYANHNRLIERGLYGALYHEINYAVDELNRGLQSNDINNVYLQSQSIPPQGSTDLSVLPNLNGLFQTIIYHLFSNSELNALISSVYGELVAMHSIRQNYRQDIVKTEAYQFYANIRDLLPDLRKLPDKYFFQVYNKLKGTPLDIAYYNSKNTRYAKLFCDKVERSLRRLINRIGSVASLYYDTAEEKKVLDESWDPIRKGYFSVIH